MQRISRLGKWRLRENKEPRKDTQRNIMMISLQMIQRNCIAPHSTKSHLKWLKRIEITTNPSMIDSMNWVKKREDLSVQKRMKNMKHMIPRLAKSSTSHKLTSKRPMEISLITCSKESKREAIAINQIWLYMVAISVKTTKCSLKSMRCPNREEKEQILQKLLRLKDSHRLMRG